MYHVWDGSQWNRSIILKVWTGSAWQKNYKFKVRDSISWLPRSISDRDDAVIIRWTTEGPTPPPPPPPVTHPVPDLGLLTLSEAQALLDPLDFTYSVLEPYEITNDINLNNKIVPLSQTPATGQLLAEGSNVTFRLYEFVQPTTTVPNLDGLLKSQADNAITNAGLVVGTPLGTEETYDTSKIGRVIVGSQFPIAGDTVNTGTSVIYDYYIQQPFATVPNLVNQNEENIYTLLSNAELTVGDRTVVPTAIAGNDNKIKSQFPVAGTQVQEGSEVDYEIWDYSLTVVPNLNNLTEQQAGDALEAALLFTGQVTSVETTNPALEGTVVPNSQSPVAGTTVQQYTSINYSVYVPNTTVAVPNVVGFSLQNAKSTLEAAELSPQLNSTIPTRTPSLFLTIASTNPVAGTIVNIESVVTYAVYVEEPKISVPNIVGQTPLSAGSAISGSSFTWGSNTLAGTPTETTSNFGKVATQSPTAGSQEYAGPINYGIYTDGRPTVPNLNGLTEAQAKTAVTNAGLNWSITLKDQTFNGEATAGTVVTNSQSPTAGSRLASGGTVSFQVWKAYVATPVTRTATIIVGYNGDVPWEWGASYNFTLTTGSRRKTSQPFYVGRFDSTNEKQHMMFQFDWNTFVAKCEQVAGTSAFSITNAELRVWANSGVGGNDNQKSLRLGSWAQDVSTSPSTAPESSSNFNARGVVLTILARGTFGYATAGSALRNDCFTFPNYPVVVYAPNTSIDNYIVNDGDVRWNVTIQWTEYV